MADIVDPAERTRTLRRQSQATIARGFQLMTQRMKLGLNLGEIAGLLEHAQVDQALQHVLQHASVLVSLYRQSFTRSAESTGDFLRRSSPPVIVRKQAELFFVFDTQNPLALDALDFEGARLIREFSEAQRLSTLAALRQGIEAGANPRAQARAFRDSIGLTQTQVQAVNRYRRGLEAGEREVLDRALRDRRFDPTIRRAIDSGEPLTRTQIKRMTDRYRERFINHRSQVIARTEALRSVHQGKLEMYRQAIENGDLNPNNLEHEWQTSLRENVRDSHADMHGQKQIHGTNFISGAGNTAPAPGLFNVAAEDIQCVCTLSTRITQVEVPQEQLTPETWKQSLSPKERESIRGWSSADFGDIRRFQATGKGSDRTRDLTRHLQRAIDRAPRWEGTGWRGLQVNDADLERLLSNEVMKLDSFASTSKEVEVAQKFMNLSGGPSNRVMMQLKMKNGADISDLSTKFNEEEVLARIGSEFRLVGSRPFGGGTLLTYEEL